MKLFTTAQMNELLKNGAANNHCRETDGNTTDFKPVVKLFAPWNAATWLLSEIDPDDNETAFGLCDLGAGEPELGYVNIVELMSVLGRFGLRIERDLHFKATKTITEYAKEARVAGRIVT